MNGAALRLGPLLVDSEIEAFASAFDRSQYTVRSFFGQTSTPGNLVPLAFGGVPARAALQPTDPSAPRVWRIPPSDPRDIPGIYGARVLLGACLTGIRINEPFIDGDEDHFDEPTYSANQALGVAMQHWCGEINAFITLQLTRFELHFAPTVEAYYQLRPKIAVPDRYTGLELESPWILKVYYEHGSPTEGGIGNLAELVEAVGHPALCPSSRIRSSLLFG